MLETGSPRRYVAAGFLLLVGTWFSMFTASLVGWSFEPKGWHRVTDGWIALVLSAAVGVLTVAVVRAVTQRPALSWWLALGLIPALYMGLAEGVGIL